VAKLTKGMDLTVLCHFRQILRWRQPKLLLRIMKLTAVILLFTCLHVVAASNAQKVTISLKFVPIQKVFEQLLIQSNVTIIYDEAYFKNAKPVSVNIKNALPVEVIKLCLSGLPYIFQEEGNTITITPTGGLNPVLFKDDFTRRSLILNAPPFTGVVTGPDGHPIAGANIIIKGTKRGTVTNSDGSFSIEANKGEVLIFSSIGFNEKQLVIADEVVGNISLSVAESKLEEVQIIAYGTTTQRTSVTNVAVLKADEIQKQPVSNPLLALQGRIPGVFVTQSSGVSGSGIKILVQGQNSILNGNDPFYVIDGVPYAAQLPSSIKGSLFGSSGVNNVDGGNPLNFINPNDIESISVLKDAAATAIYGSRAANGAILITTKKGKAGTSKIDIRIEQGMGNVTRKRELLDIKEYLQMRREAIANDGLSVQETDYDINGFWDTTKNDNWQGKLIGGTARYSNFSGSISGGTQQTQYSVNANYRKETTVFPGDFADRKGSLHFNLTSQSSNQKFRFSMTAGYMYDLNQLPGADLTNIAVTLAPNSPNLQNPDGTINWMPDANGISTFKQNPIAQLQNKYSNTTRNLLANSTLSYQIIPGLEVRTSLGYNNLVMKEVSEGRSTAIAPEDRANILRTASYGLNDANSFIIEPVVSYKKWISKSSIDIVLGGTIQQNKSDFVKLGGSGYVSDEVLRDMKAASDLTATSTQAPVYKYSAGFIRINYLFNNKYVVDFNARRDGSSRFGSQNRFHNFGSIGGAWIFSSEKFIADKFSFLSFGKLRGSYGSTGSDQIGDYSFLGLFDPFGVGNPYQGIGSYVPKNIKNPYLQWEETRKLQFGIDLGFIHDRILFNANYNRNRSSNQLLPYILPIITGFSFLSSNFPALIENTGWEFALNTININKREFQWRSSFNITIPKNKLISFPDLTTSPYYYMLEIGKPINVRKVFSFAGVNPESGLYEFYDSHGGKTSNPDPLTDQSIYINPFPKYYGGLQNSIVYRSFSLDFLFSFVKQQASNFRFGNLPGYRFQNQPKSVLSRWTKSGDHTLIQKYSSSFSNFDALVANINVGGSDAGNADASYMRLKNISVSWNLPEEVCKKIKLQRFQLFMLAQNLITFTNFEGLDPENASINNLPPLRVVTFGANISF
jgi:TonB-dependent starch-binding outer membrane protein SusC